MSMTNYAPQRYPKLDSGDTTGWVLAAEFKARTVEVLGTAGTLKVYESNDSTPPNLASPSAPGNTYYQVGVTDMKDKSFYDADNSPTVTSAIKGYNIETLGSMWVCAVVTGGTAVSVLQVTIFDNR